jgi:peptidoglycan/LPS O-acetylase OafA/YrhL
MVFIWKMTSESGVKTLGFKFLCALSLVTALAVILGTSHEDLDLYVIGLPLFNLSVAVMLFWLVSSRRTVAHKILENRILRWVGNISYGLYLWHYMMYEFAKKEFANSGVQIIVAVIFAFVVASASYYLVEKPFLRLKFRFNFKAAGA